VFDTMFWARLSEAKTNDGGKGRKEEANGQPNVINHNRKWELEL
jgi:hypothetical protein